MSAQKEIDKAIAHLMDWAEKPEWVERKTEVFEEHLSGAADRLGMDIEDLSSELVAQELGGMMIGFFFEDLASRRFPPDGDNLVEDFLKRRGWREGVRGRRYLRQLSESVLSLYEVNDVVPGSYCDITDLLRGGKTLRVYEQMGTRNMVKWDHIAARVLAGSGRLMFSGAFLPFPHEASTTLRKIFDKTVTNLEAEFAQLGPSDDSPKALDIVSSGVLDYSVIAFSQVWLMHVMERLAAPLPELVTRDGEAFVFADTRFAFEKANRKKIAARLAGADCWECDSEAEDKWFWLATDSENEADPEPVTILGFLQISEHELRLTTHSVERSENGAEALNKLLGDLVEPPLTLLQSAGHLMEEQSSLQENSANLDLLLPEADPLELENLMSAYLDQHYRETLDEPVPALDDATPRQCSKTEAGKEKLIVWLKYLENQEQRQIKREGGTPYDFSWMWDELGLKRSGPH